MAIDFPLSPAAGQQFTPFPGSPTYVWQSPVWRLASGGISTGVYIGDTPPLDPVHGMLFWESDTGNSFIYFIDAGGGPGQWIQFNVAPPPSPLPNFIRKQRIEATSAISLHADTKAFLVEVQGAGGAGGGAQAGVAGQGGAGGGGGSGAYLSHWRIRTAGMSLSCVIGAASVGVSQGNGGKGGDSGFTDGVINITAIGGAGGLFGPTSSISNGGGGAGGAFSGSPEMGIAGNAGFYGMGTWSAANGVMVCVSGHGADSRYGSGGASQFGVAASGGAAGFGATGYGAGGGGGISMGSGATQGGVGSQGIVLITEYR